MKVVELKCMKRGCKKKREVKESDPPPPAGAYFCECAHFVPMMVHRVKVTKEVAK